MSNEIEKLHKLLTIPNKLFTFRTCFGEIDEIRNVYELNVETRFENILEVLRSNKIYTGKGRAVGSTVWFDIGDYKLHELFQNITNPILLNEHYCFSTNNVDDQDDVILDASMFMWDLQNNNNDAKVFFYVEFYSCPYHVVEMCEVFVMNKDVFIDSIKSKKIELNYSVRDNIDSIAQKIYNS